MEIKFTKNVQKGFVKLNLADKKQIKSAIRKLTNTPPDGDIKLMEGSKEKCYRLRVGQHRVIFRFEDSSCVRILIIINIGPRNDIYKH